MKKFCEVKGSIPSKGDDLFTYFTYTMHRERIVIVKRFYAEFSAEMSVLSLKVPVAPKCGFKKFLMLSF